MGYKGWTVTLPLRTLLLWDWGGGLNGRLGREARNDACKPHAAYTNQDTFWIWGPNLAMLMAYSILWGHSGGATGIFCDDARDGPRSFGKSK